jgi:biotin carboxyl carrier protein
MTEELTMNANSITVLFSILLTAVLMSAPVFAHEGEAHSKDKQANPTASTGALTPSAADREAPTRMTGGGLFVPKPVQRQLGLRTVRAVLGELSATIELNGRVVSEPGAGGRIQATQAGTVVSGARGFPTLGTRVRKGEVVAQLRPLVSSLERAGEVAEQADLSAQQQLAERRAQRLALLEGSVPAKEIEAARIEARALGDRLAARKGGLDVEQPLRAPASGVVGVVHVVAGEVVDAKDILFEIIDPSRLAVEALSYDPTLPARMRGSAQHEALAGESRLVLGLIGAGLQLREQALPMQFRILSAGAPVAVGQPVKVLLKTTDGRTGIALPKSALNQNSAGETVVWVHTEAERFEARRVTYRALGVDSVAVDSGLNAGERVVVAGATLLAQVR